jgi:hypothetical protein
VSLLAQLAIAGLIFAAGAAGGIKWHAGVVAARDLAALQAQETDRRQQRQFNDLQAGRHAGQVASLQGQLGNAREKIASLSGRSCLDAGTVGLLNATGVVDGGAAAGEPARAAEAAAAAAGDSGQASDRDVAGYIALCRTRYAELAEQVNRILDIEDRRHPP